MRSPGASTCTPTTRQRLLPSSRNPPSRCIHKACTDRSPLSSPRFAEPEQRHTPTPSSSQYARKPVQYGRLSPQPPPSGHGNNTSYSQTQTQQQHLSHTMSPPPQAGPRPPVLQNRPPPVSRPPPSPAPPSPNQDPTLLPLFRAVDKNGSLVSSSSFSPAMTNADM